MVVRRTAAVPRSRRLECGGRPPRAAGARPSWTRGVSSPSHDGHEATRLSGPRTRPRPDPGLGRAPGPPRDAARAGDGGRPGRRRHAGRRAQAPLDQEGLQAVGPQPRRLDDRPDHARGQGHARQGPGAVRQGDAAAAGRPDDPVGRRDLRLSGDGRRGQGRPPRLDGQGRQRRHWLPVRPDLPRHQDRRGAGRRRGRRGRGRHGHRPWRLPVRGLPDGLRGDRGGQGSLRRPRT